MKAMVCQNCGAHINPLTMRCEYCGTQYEKQADRIYIVSEHPAVITLSARAIIEDEVIYRFDKAEEYVLNDITRKLADSLKDYLDLRITPDPLNCCQHIDARVRVVKPGHRF